jgi:hypothetical protein
MTDKIGIDEQIAHNDHPLPCPFCGRQRIEQAKVPEKPDIGRMSDLNALGTMIDAYDTLLDFLRRETAKNERIKELLVPVECDLTTRKFLEGKTGVDFLLGYADWVKWLRAAQEGKS